MLNQYYEIWHKFHQECLVHPCMLIRHFLWNLTVQKNTFFDQQNAPEMWHRPLNLNLYVDYGDMIHFSISAMASKWGQKIVSWVFGAANGGWVNQNIVLRRVIKTSHDDARCFDGSTQHDVLIYSTAVCGAKHPWNYFLASFGGHSSYSKKI